MPLQFSLQESFAHGEISRKAFNVELQSYYMSAEFVRNAYIDQIGSAHRRHGTRYQIPYDDILMDAEFVYDNNTTYLLGWKDIQLVIYKKSSDNSLSLVNTIASPYTAAQLSDIQFSQFNRTLYSVHGDVAPYQLTRGADDHTWTYAAVSFQNLPSWAYESNYFSTTFTLPTNGQKAGTTGVSLTASTAVFTAAHVGGVFESIGDNNNPNGSLGLASITAFISTTEVTVTIVNSFPIPSPAASASYEGAQSYLAEPLFSATRGWPSVVSVAQSRLLLASGNESPSVFSLSKVNVPANFNDRDGADVDAGITFSLPMNEHNKIEWVVNNKTLQIFGTQSIYSNKSSILSAQSLSINQEGDSGCSNAVKPQVFNNDIYFVSQLGNAVFKNIFQAVSSTFIAESVSAQADHLIVNPVSAAVYNGDQTTGNRYLFIVNGDGTLAVLQSVADENISAWSLSGTGPDIHDPSSMNPNKGKFKRIFALDNVMYVVVERIINQETKTYLEELRFDDYTDCTIRQTYQENTTVIANLAALEAEKVKVIANGLILDDQVVTNGSITIEKASTDVKVGLPFSIQVTPVPVNIAGSRTKYLPKKIVRGWVDVYESIGVKVNGTYIPELKFGSNVLDLPPQPKTSYYEVRPLGYGQSVSIDITQTDPLPFTILGVGYELEI